MPTPYLIGSHSQAASTATCVIPVTTATSTGDAIIVGSSSSTGAGATLVSVTDTKTNAYVILPNHDSAQIVTYMAVALNTTALTGADTITATWSAAGTALNAGAVGCPGIALTGAVDQAVHASSAGSTAPSVTSGTLAQAGELCLAVEANGNGGGAIIWAAGWTGGTSLPVTMHAGATEFTAMAAQTVTSTSPVTANGTITSSKWAMLLATLLLAAAPVTVSVPTGTVTAVGGSVSVILQAISFPSIPGGAQPGQATPGDPGALAVLPPVTGPYLIGIQSDPAGSATTVMNVIAATAAGAGVVVAAQCASTIPTSVTDTQGNNYTLAVSDAAGNQPTWAYLATNTAALATTDSVIVAWASTAGAKNALAVTVPGLGGGIVIDVAISADGSSFFPAITSGVLAQANETAIAVISSPNSSGALTWAAGWDAQGLAHNDSTTYTALAVQVVSSTAPLTASGVLA